jgi:alanine racemase
MRTREFVSCLSAIRRQVKSPLIVQCLDSSGISFGLKAPETNAVCPGELLFGLNARATETIAGAQALDTQPVLTDIRSIVGALRYIPSGTRFGFGGRLIASHKTRLGVLPIGYSNSALVPKGERAVGLLGQSLSARSGKPKVEFLLLGVGR